MDDDDMYEHRCWKDDDDDVCTRPYTPDMSSSASPLRWVSSFRFVIYRHTAPPHVHPSLPETPVLRLFNQ